MEYKDLKQMPADELSRLLAKTREELRAARFRVRVGEDRQVREIRALRKRAAYILTALTAATKAAAKASAKTR